MFFARSNETPLFICHLLSLRLLDGLLFSLFCFHLLLLFLNEYILPEPFFIFHDVPKEFVALFVGIKLDPLGVCVFILVITVFFCPIGAAFYFSRGLLASAGPLGSLATRLFLQLPHIN